MSSSDPQTALLEDWDTSAPPTDICKRCSSNVRGQPALLRRLLPFVIFDICQILFFVVAYHVVFHLPPEKPQASYMNLYKTLSSYNQTKKFYGNPTAVSGNAEADKLWATIQDTDGVVAVDTMWARQQQLPYTKPHPENPNLSIYQIDAFHNLHCLYRIRNRLISTVPISEWPRADNHTMHCLDYLREQLMCHADILLEGTYNYYQFQNDNGHQCRDFGAIQAWARRLHWTGHHDYLRTVLGLHPRDFGYDSAEEHQRLGHEQQ